MTKKNLWQLQKMLCQKPLEEYTGPNSAHKLPNKCLSINYVLSDFLSGFEVDNRTNCWNWIKAKYNTGYGRLYQRGAHRISSSLFLGHSKGLYVLHSCDNPACVNPKHLRYGTQKENIVEAVKRKRLVNLGGWHHTKEAKAKISARSKGSNNPMYGVSIAGKDHPNWGKPRSEETKLKISESLKKKQFINQLKDKS